MDLEDVHAELVEEIRDKLCYVGEMRRAADLADIFDALVAELEGLGLCHLLGRGDAGLFQENLARAAHARRFFLRRSATEGNTDDRHLALSRNRGFLDAIVAGSRSVACDIARTSPPRFNADWEYEDDHCFYRALHAIALARDVFPAAEVEASNQRYEEVLEGAASPQLDALKALAARDAAAFERAIDDLVAAEAERNEEALTSAAVLERDILVWPTRRVSIEALALLKFAELVGIPIARDFPMCPRLARLAWSDRSFRDLFEEIERLP